MKNRKLTRNHRRKERIKCECGTEIEFLHDVKAMGEAIEDHVALHLKRLKVPACSASEAENLRDALIAQVLRIASQSVDEDNL